MAFDSQSPVVELLGEPERLAQVVDRRLSRTGACLRLSGLVLRADLQGGVADLVGEGLCLVEPHARALRATVLVVDVRKSDERRAAEVCAAGRLRFRTDLDEAAFCAAQLAQPHERPAPAEA